MLLGKTRAREPSLVTASSEVKRLGSEDTTDTESCITTDSCDEIQPSADHAQSQDSSARDDNTTSVGRKAHKEVTFCGCVRVMLIPSVVDYKEANICETLWWTAADMKRFHVETVMSLHEFMRETHIKDTKVALRMLLEAEVFKADSSSLRL